MQAPFNSSNQLSNRSSRIPECAWPLNPTRPQFGDGVGVLQQTLKNLSDQFIANLPRHASLNPDCFHTKVLTSRLALRHFKAPEDVPAPRFFFESKSLSPIELDMSDCLHVNIQRSLTPNDVQCNLQLFLNEAIEMGSRALIDYSLYLGANPNWNDHLGCVPLHVAIQSNNIRMVRVLLEMGAHPSVMNSGGVNAFDCALGRHPAILRLLIDAKANRLRPR